MRAPLGPSSLLLCVLAACSSSGGGSASPGPSSTPSPSPPEPTPTRPAPTTPTPRACARPGAVIEQERPGAGSDCFFLPPPGGFRPHVEWRWRGGGTLPDSHQVIALPIVIDLTQDGVPEVVVATYSLPTFVAGAVLRALAGDSGREVFTVTDVRGRLSPQSGLAAADIDGDGLPEIVGIGVPREYSAEDAYLPVGTRVVAFEHDGLVKWVSDEEVLAGWGAPAIADLDEDGSPEIVVGNTAFDAAGRVLWRGAGGNGGIVRGDPSRSHMGSLAVVANLDVTGPPEVVAGNTAYRADGSILWRRADLPDGLVAVANLDCDPRGEVVLVGQNKLHLLDDGGRTLCGPVVLPGGPANNRGGAPTVADFDGDGIVEIATAGSSRYTVYEIDCSVRWSAETQDVSSNVSSSSVFDFEGDGSAEVVYNDERKLRIYRGTDGAVLFEMDNLSDTTFEYPLIVDVDADHNAEIVVVANDRTGRGGDAGRGVVVLGDGVDHWVGTRRIWNQHAYSVTNVARDGTVPRRVRVNWEAHNNFRQNVPEEGDPAFAAPDLVVGEPERPPRALTHECPLAMTLRARVRNEGALAVPPGVPVAFYYTPVGLDERRFIGVVTTGAGLPPGAGVDVELRWESPYTEGDFHLFVVVDDDGRGGTAHSECRETNNEAVYRDLVCRRIG